MKKKLLIGAALILSVGMACTSGAGDCDRSASKYGH